MNCPIKIKTCLSFMKHFMLVQTLYTPLRVNCELIAYELFSIQAPAVAGEPIVVIANQTSTATPDCPPETPLSPPAQPQEYLPVNAARDYPYPSQKVCCRQPYDHTYFYLPYHHHPVNTSVTCCCNTYYLR